MQKSKFKITIEKKFRIPFTDTYPEDILRRIRPRPLSLLENLERLMLLRKQQRFLERYEEFLDADQENRHRILAKPISVLERWFTEGVTYKRTFLGSLAQTLTYANQPEELYRILERAHGKILHNILLFKRIPEYEYLGLFMLSKAIPFSGKREAKVSFCLRFQGLSHKPIYETEGLDPRERAQLIANNWYDLNASRLYRFVSAAYEEYKRRIGTTIRDVQSYIALELRLHTLQKGWVERVTYYACREGCEFEEISEVLRSLGETISPDAVRQTYEEVKRELGC